MTGRDFPARVIERLGEPYISGHQHDVDHMGLGIFIARTLLGRTGGEIAFANHPEGGAEVTVRWQRDALEFDMPPDAGSTSIEDLMALSPDGFQPNERMLLVVDDDEPFRKRLARAMEMRGFAVVTAESVAEGIAVAQQNPPGYAVLDLRLNDGSGLDIVTAIRPPSQRCADRDAHRLRQYRNGGRSGKGGRGRLPRKAGGCRYDRSRAPCPRGRPAAAARASDVGGSGSPGSIFKGCSSNATAMSPRPHVASTCTGARCNAS